MSNKTCRRITVPEYLELLKTEPNPKGYSDLSTCTCLCDIPNQLTISGFADDFGVFNGVYDLVRTELNIDGKTRGRWERLGGLYDVSRIFWNKEFDEPGQWIVANGAPINGSPGTGQSICPGFSNPVAFGQYAKDGDECVPVGGEFRVGLVSPSCTIIPPNQRSYNVSISYS